MERQSRTNESSFTDPHWIWNRVHTLGPLINHHWRELETGKPTRRNQCLRSVYLLAFFDGLAFFSLLRSFRFLCFLTSSTDLISFFPFSDFTRSSALRTLIFLFS